MAFFTRLFRRPQATPAPRAAAPAPAEVAEFLDTVDHPTGRAGARIAQARRRLAEADRAATSWAAAADPSQAHVYEIALAHQLAEVHAQLGGALADLREHGGTR